MKLYGVVVDYGDGSAGISWYSDKEELLQDLEEEESLYMNEGEPATTITLPEGVTPEMLGIRC